MLRFLGQNYSEYSLSILVVSSSPSICKKLDEEIKNASKDNYMIYVHTTNSISSFLKFGSAINIDFIVFAMDTCFNTSVKTFEKSIMMLDKHFLLMSRVCIVGANDSPADDVDIINNNLWNVAQSYHCPLIIGQLMKKDSCCVLGQKITNLAITVCGARVGIPHIISVAL